MFGMRVLKFTSGVRVMVRTHREPPQPGERVLRAWSTENQFEDYDLDPIPVTPLVLPDKPDDDRDWEDFCKGKSDPYDEAWGDDR